MVSRGKRRQALKGERGCKECNKVLFEDEYRYCSSKCRRAVRARVESQGSRNVQS